MMNKLMKANEKESRELKLMDEEMVMNLVALDLDDEDDFNLDDFDLSDFDLDEEDFDLELEDDEDTNVEENEEEVEDDDNEEEVEDDEEVIEENEDLLGEMIEDDEDSLDDIFDDEEEEIVEEVKEEPKKEIKKKVTKKVVKDEPKKVVKKEVKPKKEEVKKTVTKKVTVKKENKVEAPKNKFGLKITEKVLTTTYEGLLNKIKVEKVDAYNEVMERRAQGEKLIPGNKKIGKTDFAKLMSLKMDESPEMRTLVLQIIRKALDGTIPKNLEDKLYDIAKPSVTALANLYQQLFADICYDLVKIESGIELINEEDCKFSFQGKLQEEKVIDNSKLTKANLSYNATLTGEYIKVESTSKAPDNVKVKGNLDKNGNFVALDEE